MSSNSTNENSSKFQPMSANQRFVLTLAGIVMTGLVVMNMAPAHDNRDTKVQDVVRTKSIEITDGNHVYARFGIVSDDVLNEIGEQIGVIPGHSYPLMVLYDETGGIRTVQTRNTFSMYGGKDDNKLNPLHDPLFSVGVVSGRMGNSSLEIRNPTVKSGLQVYIPGDISDPKEEPKRPAKNATDGELKKWNTLFSLWQQGDLGLVPGSPQVHLFSGGKAVSLVPEEQKQ